MITEVNTQVVVEVSNNYPHRKLSGKQVVADLTKIVPNGGMENSEILITHGGKSCFIRYANLKITNSTTREVVNKAIKKSLDSKQQQQQSSPPNLRRYRVSQLSSFN